VAARRAARGAWLRGARLAAGCRALAGVRWRLRGWQLEA
jgi:hypothetical protein